MSRKVLGHDPFQGRQAESPQSPKASKSPAKKKPAPKKQGKRARKPRVLNAEFPPADAQPAIAPEPAITPEPTIAPEPAITPEPTIAPKPTAAKKPPQKKAAKASPRPAATSTDDSPPPAAEGRSSAGRSKSSTHGADSPPSEASARRELEDLLRSAISSVANEIHHELSEPELREMLRSALKHATGTEPRGQTVPDLLGEIGLRLASSLPVDQIRLALGSLDAGNITSTFLRGFRVAESLVASFNPRHLPDVDDFGYDHEFTERFLPFFDFMYSSYWRCDAVGVENLPSSGRGLLVANHSGVVPWDAAMLVTAIRRAHPNQRHLRCLMLDLFATMPFMGSFFMRLGQIRACPENGLQLLQRGHLVGVFPEGLKGIGKLYSQRYKLQRFGRGGYVRLAIRAHAPIVPAVVIGGEEIYPLFYRADWLARLFSFPYFPITLTFPWLGVMGLIPMPSKWLIDVGSPISLDDYDEDDAEDDLVVNDISDRVKSQMQDMLYAGLKRRRSVFLS